jgi:hypothetical protein
MFEPNHNSGFVWTLKQCPKFGTQIFEEEGMHGKYNGMFHNQIGEVMRTLVKTVIHPNNILHFLIITKGVSEEV